MTAGSSVTAAASPASSRGRGSIPSTGWPCRCSTNTIDGPALVLANGVLRAVELAAAGRSATAPADLAPYTGRFATLWGVLDVVALGGRLFALDPTLDDPVATAQRLEVVDDDTLRIAEAPGYGSPGERYVYDRAPDGAIRSVRGGSGSTALPIETFRADVRAARRGSRPGADGRSHASMSRCRDGVPADVTATLEVAPRPRTVRRSLTGCGRWSRRRWRSRLASLAVALRWRGSDLPAHFFRVALVERDGFEIWNNQWFGGHHTLGYGALFPLLGATLGIWTVAVLSAGAAALLADLLITRGLGRRCVPASLWFAAGTVTNVAIGRLPFALGLADRPRRRWSPPSPAARS